MGITVCMLDSELQMAWDRVRRGTNGSLPKLALQHRYDQSDTFDVEIVAEAGNACDEEREAGKGDVTVTQLTTDHVDLLQVRLQAGNETAQCILHSKFSFLRGGPGPGIIAARRRIRLSGCRFVRLPCANQTANYGGNICRANTSSYTVLPSPTYLSCAGFGCAQTT